MGIRCFLGLPLPESYQQGLETISQCWRPRLRSKMSWTRKGNWHITLSFLGDISEDLLEQVQLRLETISRQPFECQAGGAGFFPPGKEPRVLWIGLRTGQESLQGLARDIEQTLLPLGFSPSRKSFQAHLTLARIRQNRKDEWRAVREDLQARQWPAFFAESFVLWRSNLTPQGPEYSPIRVYRLA